MTDDWAAFESDAKRRASVKAQIDSLVGRADVVLACSRRLCDVALRSGVQAVYLPNAIGGILEPGPLPAKLSRLPRPRVGYVGTLHAARLDLNLLIEAARLRSDWSFVLSRPGPLNREDRSQLFGTDNVHHLGTCAHAQAPLHQRL